MAQNKEVSAENKDMCAIERELSPKERVQQELTDLMVRKQKLDMFLYGEGLIKADLTDEMIQLLDAQSKAMQTYATILQNRLAIWDNGHNRHFHHEFRY